VEIGEFEFNFMFMSGAPTTILLTQWAGLKEIPGPRDFDFRLTWVQGALSRFALFQYVSHEDPDRLRDWLADHVKVEGSRFDLSF